MSNTEKKDFTVSARWEMSGLVEVKAESLSEAIRIVEEDNSIALQHGKYIEGSFIVP